jgi:hypothetical protein
MTARLHATAGQTLDAIGPPSREPRIASTTAVTGWFLAKLYNHDGIVWIGTNALLA